MSTSYKEYDWEKPVQLLYDHINALPAEELAKFKKDPEALLDAIDKFEEEQNKKTGDYHLMTVGPEKRKVVEEEIAQNQPYTFAELGGFCGYSAIAFAHKLKQTHPGYQVHYYSLEVSPFFAKVTSRFTTLAGLGDIVTVLVGPAAEGLERLKNEYNHAKIDFFFIDHWKDLYVPDLQKAEELGLVQYGTVITADNIYFPGAPEYAKYVRLTPAEKKKDFPGKGNPNLEYDTRTEEVPLGDGKKDGVEVTLCTGVLTD
ncbi:putative catechol O-methyltransferase 1 [Yarrowia sp. B02]|nr:putative catechol O-methyltransferase 1 [Yarrowia sp. B02]